MPHTWHDSTKLLHTRENFKLYREKESSLKSVHVHTAQNSKTASESKSTEKHKMATMVDETTLTEAQKKARRSKKFQYRGVELDKLLDLSNQDLMELIKKHKNENRSSRS